MGPRLAAVWTSTRGAIDLRPNWEQCLRSWTKHRGCACFLQTSFNPTVLYQDRVWWNILQLPVVEGCRKGDCTLELSSLKAAKASVGGFAAACWEEEPQKIWRGRTTFFLPSLFKLGRQLVNSRLAKDSVSGEMMQQLCLMLCTTQLNIQYRMELTRDKLG